MLDAQACLSTQAFILMYWLSGLRRYNRAISPTELPWADHQKKRTPLSAGVLDVIGWCKHKQSPSNCLVRQKVEPNSLMVETQALVQIMDDHHRVMERYVHSPAME